LTNQAVDRLSEVLSRIVGRRCIGFTAGESAGSVVDLEFEPRKIRSKPLKNPHLTPEQRTGEPEYSILVECAWRLDSNYKVLCGAWDDNSLGGRMLSGLEATTGALLERFVLSDPGLDLELWLSNGLCFRIFCDQVNEVDENDNYSVFCPDRIFTVGTKSLLKEEDYEGI
jgi:hypothetical protein